MARVLLSDTDAWELVDRDQDLRGWEVRDARGTPIGEVGDMIIDTDAARVDTLVLEDGSTFRAADVHLADGVVYVDSYGAPAGARPYADHRGVRRTAAPAAPPPTAPPREDVVGERRVAAGAHAYGDYEDDFRRHYRDAYGDLDYTDYAPAYRFGYDMGYDDRYAGRAFGDAEADLRADYYRRHGYPMSDNIVWHRVRDAVRHAYDFVHGRR